MLVADIVKTVNQKETLDGLLLHGVVRSVINIPSEFSGVVLSSGEFAILDLYAVTCKEENHFGETKSTMLTPQGSIVFILNDRSLIGKLVTIKGSGYKGYVKLRKQKSESKIVGFNCLEFRKSTGPNWVVIPNTVVEFKGTEDKEITDYLNESNTFGFNYLDITKKYMSFCGSFDYQTKTIVEVGQTSDSHFNTSFAPTWKTNLNDLKNKVYSAQYGKVFDFSASGDECLFTHYTNTLLNKVLAYNEDDDLQYRLIPHTNSRFAEVVPRGSVRDYLSLLKVLFKTNFPQVGTNTNFTYEELERILGYCPHYLYLKGELPFDLAEKIFYINGDTDKSSVSVYFRSISLIVEGAKQTYKRNDTTYLLGSLASNLTCKVPEELRENIRTTGTPLSKEEFGFVRYFLESLPQYEVDSASMYYTVKSSEHYLSKAKDSGLIVDFGRSYALTEYANMELSVLDRFALLQESRIDYSDSALDGVLSTLKDERSIEFTGNERQSFLTLNSNLGLIMASGVSNKDALEEAFHLMSITESSTILDTVVVVKDYDAPSWVHSRKVPVFSHTVVDMPLNVVNSGYLISLKGSKKVTFKYSPKLSTIYVLVRMLKTAFESGYSFENMYVISDLEKHFSAYKVSKKLVELLGYSEELQVGSPVYLDEKTLAWVTDLGKNKENISIMIDGSSAPVIVNSSRLSPALCVTSDVAVRSPKDIAYVTSQRGYGDYYTEDVYNSLDSVTKGVAFIGDEDFIKGTHFKVGTPNSTLLQKRLLK